MKKKRYIMQYTSMTTFTAPVFLAEMYDEQIQELGFRDKTEALLYLAEGIWNERNGKQNSFAVRNILKHVSLERDPILRLLPRVYRGVRLVGERKSKILSLTDFGYLSNLMNSVMEAFMLYSKCYRRMLRKEMHASFVIGNPSSGYVQTYISGLQYDKLFEMAIRGGMSLTGMIRSTIEAVLMAEEVIPERWLVPLEIQDAISDYLHVEGFTCHNFSRDIQLRINIGCEENCRGIQMLLCKYEIPGFNEFLRRVILFLLNSNSIEFQNIPDKEEQKNFYFDETELYMNDRLSCKDFVRSIYQ